MKQQPSATDLQRRGFCSLDSPVNLSAFTLVEMLVVIAIIAVLTGLALPALQGLTGTSGLRGGVNTVMATLDQARAAAIENGATVYVGFPSQNFTNVREPGMRYSSMIVFRGPRWDEAPDTIQPLSRWIRLPSGISVLPTNMSLTNISPSVSTRLPKLAEAIPTIAALSYDRFGRITTRVTAATNLIVGEAIVSGSRFQWKGTNQEALTAQRLTGRWVLMRR